MWRAMLAVLLVGCGANLDDNASSQTIVDAPGSSSGSHVDAPSGTTSDAALAADAPTSAARRVVYLNFTGTDIVKGANQHSDATTTTPTVGWMYGSATTGHAPAYGDQGSVAAITAGVTSRLQNLAIVTTTRPTSGEYVMIIFGGTANNVHSYFGGGVSQIDCGDVMKNDVGWLPDGMSAADAADAAIGAIELGLGLSAVDDSTDCLCEWGNYAHCARNTSPCVLHDAAPIDQNVVNDPNTGSPLKCSGATQDEIVTITNAFK
jgi:hypothetical protein